MESYNIIIWLGDINCHSVGMEDDGGNYYYTNVALRNFTSPHLIKVVGVGCPRNDEQCGGDGVCRSVETCLPTHTSCGGYDISSLAGTSLRVWEDLKWPVALPDPK